MFKRHSGNLHIFSFSFVSKGGGISVISYIKLCNNHVQVTKAPKDHRTDVKIILLVIIITTYADIIMVITSYSLIIPTYSVIIMRYFVIIMTYALS